MLDDWVLNVTQPHKSEQKKNTIELENTICTYVSCTKNFKKYVYWTWTKFHHKTCTCFPNLEVDFFKADSMNCLFIIWNLKIHKKIVKYINTSIFKKSSVAFQLRTYYQYWFETDFAKSVNLNSRSFLPSPFAFWKNKSHSSQKKKLSRTNLNRFIYICAYIFYGQGTKTKLQPTTTDSQNSKRKSFLKMCSLL